MTSFPIVLNMEPVRVKPPTFPGQSATAPRRAVSVI